MDMLIALLATVIGLLIGYWLGRARTSARQGAEFPPFEILQKREEPLQLKLAELSSRLEQSQMRAMGCEKEKEALAHLLSIAKTELSESREKESSLRDLNAKMTPRVEVLEKEKMLLLEQLQAHKAQFSEVEKLLEVRFKVIAQSVMDDHARKFQEFGTKNLGAALDPLKQRIQEFDKQVQDTHGKDLKERAILQQRVQDLIAAQVRLSEDANRLAKALRTDTRIQGNWGEIVLRRILESSGLREGSEFIEQGKGLGLVDDEGGRQKPDFVVNIPGDKQLIIDSKVTINSFERYLNSESDSEKEAAKKEFLTAIRKHASGLADKHYHDNKNLKTPEYVLMFMPTEAAFAFTMAEDETLFEEFWARKIVIVSPVNLLACLKTVEATWKFERQNQNVEAVIELGKRMVSKFVDFLKEMESVGRHLEAARDSWEGARTKLQGKGNLITGMKRLTEMGIPASKEWPKIAEDEVEIVTTEKDDSVA